MAVALLSARPGNRVAPPRFLSEVALT